MALGVLTAFGTTVIAERYKWAERRTVALELKIKCATLREVILGEQVGKSSDSDLKPVWEKLTTALTEIRQISVRNNIDPEDRDMSA